jgi:uncharacterized protein (DUF1501 family)
MTNKHRREFLHKALCATASSAAFGSLMGKFSLAQASIPGVLGGTDYRALVCVFLYGGNDSFNMLLPRDNSHYNTYSATRQGLAIPQGQILPLSPTVAPSDGGQYGLHPKMAGLKSLFDTGKAALVSNVGPLLYPINKTQYENESVPVPAQLFSHSDQQLLWQTPTADTVERMGWGGRLADLFFATNPNPLLSMNISLDGENVYQAGVQVSPYFMSPYGAEAIWPVTDETYNARRRTTFDALMNASYAHPFQRAYVQKVKRSRDIQVQITNALLGAPGDQAPYSAFDTAWAATGREVPYIARQLQMVARIIGVRSALGMRRQIFFVSAGGFDTHDTQLADQAELMEDLSLSLKTFYDVINSTQINLASSVTTFTASDFGRTLSSNGDGTDHGWGSHHVVVGGAVNGNRIYGALPSLLANNNPDDAGYGQIIPTTSVDQYAATLATWYGVDATQRATLFPNLGRFATPSLGFMQPPPP